MCWSLIYGQTYHKRANMEIGLILFEIHRRRKIGLVGGAELRAPKARETSRGVRGHPPRKILKSRVPEMAFPAFLRVYRILNVIKPLPHLRRRRQGGLSPPFFPLLQSWGALAPPAPPVPPPMQHLL